MNKLDEYSQLVSSIYDAAFDFERWPIVLERVADALGGNAGSLAKHDLTTGDGAVILTRTDPIFARLYAEHYVHVNVLFGRVGRVPTGTCMSDRDVMSKDEFFRTEFYNDFLRPQEVHSFLSAFILAEKDCVATFNISRCPRGGEWEREHLDLMRSIAPHLHRAVQINLQLGEARFEAESSAEVLNNLACGVVIVSGDAKVLFVNHAAKAIVATADGISITLAGLRAAERQQSSALRKLIAAAATGGTEPKAAGGVLSLSRPSGRRPLAVLVAPLHVAAGWFVNGQPHAIVFVVDPDRAPIVPEKYLQRLYDLTPAEAAVAVRILRGEGLQAVADSLRVSLPTVRTLRQRVFGKTETRRQAELVRVILEGAAGIGLERLAL
jgi:DNA-binding CsgD family transcriptional regulator